MDASFLEKIEEMDLPKDLEEELKMAMPNRDDYVSLDTHPQLMRKLLAFVADRMEGSQVEEVGQKKHPPA